MECEILRLQALSRAVLSRPAPSFHERRIAEVVLDCLRELHAASARMARTGGAIPSVRLLR